MPTIVTDVIKDIPLLRRRLSAVDVVAADLMTSLPVAYLTICALRGRPIANFAFIKSEMAKNASICEAPVLTRLTTQHKFIDGPQAESGHRRIAHCGRTKH